MSRKPKYKIVKEINLILDLPLAQGLSFFELKLSNKSVQLWIAQDTDTSSETKKLISQLLSASLANAGLNLAEVSYLTLKPKITNLSVAKEIRFRSPIEFERLMSVLYDGRFAEFTELELKRALDYLRKNGLIIRLKNESYVMTLDGLNVLGTRKGRQSPDIKRVLALAQGEI